MPRSPASTARQQGLRRFYVHLVATLSGQLAFAIAALALGHDRGGVVIYPATTLALAAHASVVFAPSASSNRPGGSDPGVGDEGRKT